MKSEPSPSFQKTPLLNLGATQITLAHYHPHPDSFTRRILKKRVSHIIVLIEKRGVWLFIVRPRKKKHIDAKKMSEERERRWNRSGDMNENLLAFKRQIPRSLLQLTESAISSSRRFQAVSISLIVTCCWSILQHHSTLGQISLFGTTNSRRFSLGSINWTQVRNHKNHKESSFARLGSRLAE